MNDVPLPTDAEQTAINHAINVNASHWHDIGDNEGYTRLKEAQETVQNDGYIPATAVALIWEILIEHDHVKAATSDDYNNGIDRDALIDALHHIIVFNGSSLKEAYSDYRAELCGIDPNHVLHINGQEIIVPEDVDVIRDPEDAPRRDTETTPDDASYCSGQPFAGFERYDDWESSAWYSSVYPSPGSADRDYEKVAEDKHAAARRAISLAKKYDVPFLNW